MIARNCHLRFLAALAILLACLTPSRAVTSTNTTEIEEHDAAYKEMEMLARVLLHIRNNYVEEKTYNELVTGALRGAAPVHELLDLLARLEPNPDRSLADLVAEPDVRAAGRLLTVVAMRRADDRTAAAIRELRGRQHRVVAVDASTPEFHVLFHLPPPLAPAGEGGRTPERSASA